MTGVRWPYLKDRVPAPAIGTVVYNPFLDRRYPEEGEELIKLDTGYDGHLLITAEIFEALELWRAEVVEDQAPIAQTATGELIRMRSAWGKLELPSLGFGLRAMIDHHPSVREPLLGRAFANELVLHLVGPRRMTEAVIMGTP